MNGVDAHDQLRLQRYSIQRSMRMKKYYQSLFLGLLDMAIVNAYIVHKQYCKETSSKALPHAQFKLALHEQLISLTAEDLLERGGTPPASRTSSPRSSASAVTDHHLEFAGDKSASGRPRYRVCKVCSLLHDDQSRTIGKSRAYCIECSSEKARVYLCDRIRTTETGNQMTCFQIWHQYLSHGKARDGARKIRLRASQNAVEPTTVELSVPTEPTAEGATEPTRQEATEHSRQEAFASVAGSVSTSRSFDFAS
ncbi:hypothetical protein P43SY_010298 [Pythium insidiosum]|uniref:PiggyBac transposable element-derived protein domain-containing protein n=1 Tax=Pythium insidiosum TaxID=114742 RepID=A0AAD5M094_PYTIN|nr:hypothetical protein P43SY_010298 [Pythium insidiosum]